jgi:quercetin dioxygenase-like cupin family protein
MPLRVYDFRRDIRNLEITPEIRARFMQIDVGVTATRHSHDLGHEIFLVLDGHGEFEIEGERAVLGPGQLCFARADEMHQVRCVGDMPLILYLSVTPHVEPTHTYWDENGQRLPNRFGGTRAFGHSDSEDEPFESLARRQSAAIASLASCANEASERQRELTERLIQLAASGDDAGTRAVIDDMWTGIYKSYRALSDVTVIWNQLAPRAAQSP